MLWMPDNLAEKINKGSHSRPSKYEADVGEAWSMLANRARLHFMNITKSELRRPSLACVLVTSSLGNVLW